MTVDEDSPFNDQQGRIYCHYHRIATATNQLHRREERCDIRKDTSPPPSKSSVVNSQQSWYYAIFVHIGDSSVEMKSSDDDKYCVGPHKPQIPTDSWKSAG